MDEVVAYLRYSLVLREPRTRHEPQDPTEEIRRLHMLHIHHVRCFGANDFAVQMCCPHLSRTCTVMAEARIERGEVSKSAAKKHRVLEGRPSKAIGSLDEP